MTSLIPVSEWVFNRYKITYHRNEDSPAELTKYLVETDTHVDGSIERNWPSSSYNYYKYEVVQENVPAPRQVGVMYGVPVYHDGWE